LQWKKIAMSSNMPYLCVHSSSLLDLLISNCVVITVDLLIYYSVATKLFKVCPFVALFSSITSSLSGIIIILMKSDIIFLPPSA
jgi:hypothetical protein